MSKKQSEEALDIQDIELPEASLQEFGLDGTDTKSKDREAVKDAADRIRSFIPKVELVPIADIKDYDNNPRINDAAVAPVKESIKRFGMNVPLTIDKDNVIATGHTRLRACKELGIEMVPCIRLDKLTDEEVQAWRLVDNKTNEFASWDWDKLSIELKEVVDNGIDLSIFDFQLKDETKDIDDPDIDETPEEPEVPFSQHGDLWIVGNHRIYCGDSTDPNDVDALMAGELADLVVTDPPYNVAYDDGEHGQIMNDSMADQQFHDFLLGVYQQMADHLKPGGAFYIFHADSEGLNFRQALKETEGMMQKQCLIWVKNSFTLGRQDYQWQHEPCLYGWKEGTGHYFVDDRKQATILNFDKPKHNDLHPTMKPVKMIAQLIANSSHVGEIVLDQFGGSGTTMIACEELGRHARLMELDPKYVDVEVMRYMGKYKGEVKLIRGGEETPFDELRARADENRKAI